MPFGEIDGGIRRLLEEALRPIEEKLKNIQNRLEEGPLRPVQFLTIKDVASLMNVAPGTVRRWIRDGKLASCQAGRSPRVKRCDLDLFMSRSAPEVDGVIDFKARAAEILGDD